MKCPHCEKSIDIDDIVYINVETYRPHSAISVTNCCNKPVVVYRRLSFEIVPYLGNKKEDDWGNKF